MVRVVACPEEPLFLYNNLNPIIIPFLESAGGNCQDAVIIVEVTALTLKLLGAFDGAAIGKMANLMPITGPVKCYHQTKNPLSSKWFEPGGDM